MAQGGTAPEPGRARRELPGSFGAILRMILLLAVVMIAIFALWEGVERWLPDSEDRTVFYLTRGLSTAAFMSFLAAWLMARYRGRFEAVLHRQSEEADRMRRFFENIVQDAGEGIISLDREGRVRSWNRSAEEIFGFRADEMIGDTLDRLVPPGAEPDAGALQSGALRRCYETRRLRRDGREFFARIVQSALHDETGELSGSSLIVADVTAAKELERRLVHVEKLTAVGEAAAGIAHEVRNALAGISGAIQVLGRNPAWQQLPEGFAEEVEHQIRRIAHIVEDLLTYARPGALRPQVSELHHILDDAVAEIRSLPEAQGVSMERDYAARDLLAEVDPAWLSQAFRNILMNACQAMEPGGTIRLSTRQVDGTLTVEIADSGPGMASELARRAFEPFYTTKARGSGLGLPIVQTIVEAHEGTVRLESAPGGGTAVILTLPASAAAPAMQRALR